VELRKLADEFGLWYIADCAQSFGARREGLPSSRLADALVISFTTGKTIFAGEGGAILTNNQKIYELLLWFTQHPYRQKRELGLSLSNEFSCNARIHPLSAVWANATLDSSLALLAKHQEFCFDIVDALNEIGLTIPIDFASASIEPSFFRLSAEWKSAPNPWGLEKELEKRGFSLQVSNCPVELLYRQAAFVVQYPSLVKNSTPCIQAERQTRQRFCLTIKK
jgi:dTDP-4-amino-4,6-dideoxygalactose transaminase